jgi:hypothetical protein
MQTLANSITGEYFDKGFVEALIARPNITGPSLRVRVQVQEKEDSPAALSHADMVLPRLITDMASAEALATKAAGSSAPGIAFDIWIERDGEASYTCGFFDGEAEDTLVVILRNKGGEMTLA